MSTIADVIGWKFDHQPGMKCQEDENGVLQIIEFPGGIPSQANQDAWTAQYATFLQNNPPEEPMTVESSGSMTLRSARTRIGRSCSRP